jgi:hypothetical protein
MRGQINPYKKRTASDIPGAALPNAILGPLECEIYPSTNHAKVVVWTIHYIPTKIVYPAAMRCKANFDATAKLPDCLRLGTTLMGAKSGLVNGAGNGRFNQTCLFAAAKYAAATCEYVGCQTGAGNWITKR